MIKKPSGEITNGAEVEFQCSTDESNPACKIKWFHFLTKWEEITTGITETNSVGANKGKNTLSTLKFKATQQMMKRKYKCEATCTSTVAGQNPKTFTSPEAILNVKGKNLLKTCTLNSQIYAFQNPTAWEHHGNGTSPWQRL
jgi:hypothetical protein